MNGTVRVMRSYDYCHFEITLGESREMTLDEINDMRKQAALLVDEAVREYKIAKKKEDRRVSLEWETESVLNKKKAIEEISQSEWTIDQAAFMRSVADKEFWKSYEADDFWYDEDPEREHHFSMLRKFQDTLISPEIKK